MDSSSISADGRTLADRCNNDETTVQPTLVMSEQIMSSVGGAILTAMLMTPFDVVKTRLQQQAMESYTPQPPPTPVEVNPCIVQQSFTSVRTSTQDLLRPPLLSTNGHSGSLVMETCCAEEMVPKLRVLNPRTESATLNCTTCGKVTLLRTGLMEHCLIEPPDVLRSPETQRFKGTLDAFVKIYRHEGLPALWRGLPPTLVMAVPATVIYFTSYDRLKEYYGSTKASTPVLAGCTARVVAVTVISPIEMLRTKMQAQRGSKGYGEYAKVLRNAVQHEGWTSLWRGLGATLLRDVPFSAVYWYGYEKLKQHFTHSIHARCAAEATVCVAPPPSAGGAGDVTLRSQASQCISSLIPTGVPFWASFSAGASSGAFAAMLTLPFDVVKTRQQTMLGETIAGVRPQVQQLSAAGIFRDILHTQGVAGLFVGLIPRIAKVAPACAIMISTYEAGKDFFAKKRLDSLDI